jgi:3D (Asp-Asp-Asp) domain-containing protein
MFLPGEECRMKRERKTALYVCTVLSAFMLFAAVISGCSGFSGCSKKGKDAKDGMLSSLTGSKGTLRVTVYAYCPCARCNTEKWKGRVATGQTMKKLLADGKNICAADPDVIPMGSIVTYNGREYVVTDTGSRIKGNMINILLGSHREVNAFGVKKDQEISYRK